MSYILMADGVTKCYIANALMDWNGLTPDEYCFNLKTIYYSDKVTFLQDLFPNFNIGTRITFSNGAWFEITEGIDSNGYLRTRIGINDTPLGGVSLGPSEILWYNPAYNSAYPYLRTASLTTKSREFPYATTTPSYNTHAVYWNINYYNAHSNNTWVYPAYVSQIFTMSSMFPVADINVRVEPTDPYDNGGTSSSGGGTGTFSDSGDNIDVPALPTLSAVDTGFITLFNPSLAELKLLASYMWAGLFDISTFKKIFADPMDCILGLSIVPVAVPSGAAAEVKVGNIGTGINITTASAQYVELDCGTLNVQEFWGAYLDYDPYTKFEIYLPYIGTHPINADDIMGKTIQVVYHVDILSGACNAYLKCGGTVLYTFIGQCASSIPITGNDWTNVINGVLSIAGAIGTMVATGGATAPMAAGTIASTAVNGFKSNVEKSGSMSGTGGMLAIQKPYLICTRPRQAAPAYQNTYLGYPSFITSQISELSGYTEIEEIHLENIPATANEKTELASILKGGVIL